MDHESNWISMRGYARRRGVTHRAVAKAIETGRITGVKRDERGRVIGIDAARADLDWVRNTDPVEAAKNGKSTMPPMDSSVAGHKLAVMAVGRDRDPLAAAGKVSDDGVPSAANSPGSGTAAEPNEYLIARAKREGYLAEAAKLDHLERLGLLVSAAAVEQEIGDILGEVKSNVFRIADRRAQVLAAESDPVRVHRVLSDEFRMVFDELSRRFAAPATGGAEQSA